MKVYLDQGEWWSAYYKVDAASPGVIAVDMPEELLQRLERAAAEYGAVCVQIDALIRQQGGVDALEVRTAPEE